MLYEKKDFYTALPRHLNSHQVKELAVLIHEIVGEAVNPLVADTPRYASLLYMLDSLDDATRQLTLALTKRAFQSPQNMRARGDIDGNTGVRSISGRRRAIFNERAALYKRFKEKVLWHVNDTYSPASKQAAQVLNQVINRRISHFETKAYSEADVEFNHLFDSIEHNKSHDIPSMTVLEAIRTLDLNHVYSDLLALHQALADVRHKQINQNAALKAMPKVNEATNELRMVLRVLLTNLHFDVVSGNSAFDSLMRTIGKLITGNNSVAQRRETIKEKKGNKDGKVDNELEQDRVQDEEIASRGASDGGNECNESHESHERNERNVGTPKEALLPVDSPHVVSGGGPAIIKRNVMTQVHDRKERDAGAVKDGKRRDQTAKWQE